MHIYIFSLNSDLAHAQKTRGARKRSVSKKRFLLFTSKHKLLSGGDTQKKVKKKKREKKTLSFFIKIIKAHSSFVRAITNQNQ